MLSNLHTHSAFCDGVNTPEEIVKSAVERGFSSVGFSGHGYTDFDLRYCMKNTDGYIAEIRRLKQEYKNKIQVYLGIEEDAFCRVNRADFDYIIGSSHYFNIGDKYYPIDSDYDYFKECLKVYGSDIHTLANDYYSRFCDYINKRKPDIIGHFDLITKFDELDKSLFLEDKGYIQISEKYLKQALKADVLFEVNTGAISRGYRTTPYPNENLLHLIKKEGGRVILSSDSHSADTLDFGFSDAKKLLKDIGFEFVYTLYNNEFVKDYI